MFILAYIILVCGCCHNLTASNLPASQGDKVLLKGLIHRNKLGYICMNDANQKGTQSFHHAVERSLCLGVGWSKHYITCHVIY